MASITRFINNILGIPPLAIAQVKWTFIKENGDKHTTGIKYSRYIIRALNKPIVFFSLMLLAANGYTGVISPFSSSLSNPVYMACVSTSGVQESCSSDGRISADDITN